LHDWSDARCIELLRVCRKAMSAKSRLLVVDAVIPKENAPHPAKIMDILMMTIAEGRERNETEFRSLFANAGLVLTRVIPTPSARAVIEARPD
jgi:hypothetical protein